MKTIRTSIQHGLIRASVAGSMFALSAQSVFAQQQGLNSAQQQLGEIGNEVQGGGAPTDLTELIGGLINAFLGVLGIIFVVLVVYAGYLYLTAAGDDGKVSKAKTLLGQAVIGLIIIIAAYAISTFVIDQLVTAATP